MGRRRKGRDLSGWLIVDKPAGITSTSVVNKVRWALDAKKAGHAGTLDPEATGVLAVALGEATKTVPFVTDATKAYRFTMRLGAATNTDDAEGEVIKELMKLGVMATINQMIHGIENNVWAQRQAAIAQARQLILTKFNLLVRFADLSKRVMAEPTPPPVKGHFLKSERALPPEPGGKSTQTGYLLRSALLTLSPSAELQAARLKQWLRTKRKG